MKDKEMIEEMAKIQCDSCKKYTGESEDCNSAECLSLRKKYANEILNAGYRKLPEDSVVLSRGEYNEFLRQNFIIDELKDCVKQASKETAEKILIDLYSEATSNVSELVELTTFEIEQLAKQFGVDLGE